MLKTYSEIEGFSTVPEFQMQMKKWMQASSGGTTKKCGVIEVSNTFLFYWEGRWVDEQVSYNERLIYCCAMRIFWNA